MSGKETELECNEERSQITTNSHADLLVVGPGVLGSLVGRRWLEVGDLRLESRFIIKPFYCDAYRFQSDVAWFT